MPQSSYMVFGCTQIANSNTHGKFTIQLRMGQEEAPMCIDTAHYPFIERFQLHLIAHSSWMGAETNRTERRRSHALEIWRLINPPREKLTQARVFAYSSSQSLLPEIAHNHRQLERTEAAAKRSAIIHQVGYIRPLRIAQVFRDKAECGFHHIRLACIKNAAIDWRKKPLVRIDDQSVSPFAARERPAHRGVNRSRTTISSINMQPQAISLADVGDLRPMGPARSRSCTDAPNHVKCTLL